MRRSTGVALTAAFVVLTAVAGWKTEHLKYQASLSRHISVDWTSWTVALLMAYTGLALVGWWAVSRDRARAARACLLPPEEYADYRYPSGEGDPGEGWFGSPPDTE